MKFLNILFALLFPMVAHAQSIGGGKVGTGASLSFSPKLSIIVIMDDDNGTTSDANYGSTDSDVSYNMPTIDLLETDGIRFTSGIYVNPACASTRASMMYSQWSIQHGIYSALPGSSYVWGNDHTISKLAKDAGVETAVTGKYQFIEDSSNNYWGPSEDGWMRWSVDSNVTPSDYSSWDRYYGTEEEYLVLGGSANPNYEIMSNYIDDDSVDRMLGFYANRDRSKPFLGIINLHNIHTTVHDPRQPAPHNSTQCASPSSSSLCYQYMHEKIDSLIATVLDNIDKTNTIVFYLSDNGSQKPNEKQTINEAGIRVPLYVYGAGISGGPISTPVTIQDLHITILDLLGVTSYGGAATLRGYSFASLLGYTSGFTGRDWASRNGYLIVAFGASTTRAVYDLDTHPNYKLVVTRTTGVGALYDISAYNPGNGTEPSDLCGGGGCVAAELTVGQQTAYNDLCTIYLAEESGATACTPL